MTGKALNEESEFLVKYTELMVSVWKDQDAERALTADPKQFAINAGLPVGAGDTVELDRTSNEGLFSKEQLLGDWNASATRHILHVPSEPLLDLSELDERELEAVAGGVSKVNIIVACVVNA